MEAADYFTFDILNHIFCYCSKIFDVARCASVCKIWNEFMNNEEFWKNYFQANIGDSSKPTHQKGKGTWREKAKRTGDIWKIAFKGDFASSLQRCFSQQMPYLFDSILTENPFNIDYSNLPEHIFFSPLHAAIAHSDIEFAHICVKHKFSPKHTSIVKGSKQPKSIEDLIQGGIVSMELGLIICPDALADTRGLLVNTMSQYQCRKNLKSVLQLINARIGLNDQQEHTLYTPLHLAAMFGCVPALEALLAHNDVKRNESDKEGCNPLIRALKSIDGYSLEVVKLLVEKGGCEIDFDSFDSRRGVTRHYYALAIACDIEERKDDLINLDIVEYLASKVENPAQCVAVVSGQNMLHLLAKIDEKENEGINS